MGVSMCACIASMHVPQIFLCHSFSQISRNHSKARALVHIVLSVCFPTYTTPEELRIRRIPGPTMTPNTRAYTSQNKMKRDLSRQFAKSRQSSVMFYNQWEKKTSRTY